MIGPKLAQIALSFGADDMDGTVKEEVITHMAGADTDQAIGSTHPGPADPGGRADPGRTRYPLQCHHSPCHGKKG